MLAIISGLLRIYGNDWNVIIKGEVNTQKAKGLGSWHTLRSFRKEALHLSEKILLKDRKIRNL